MRATIIATGVFYGLFVNKLSSSTGSGKMVVVAARPLPAGTVLAEKDVQAPDDQTQVEEMTRAALVLSVWRDNTLPR